MFFILCLSTVSRYVIEDPSVGYKLWFGSPPCIVVTHVLLLLFAQSHVHINSRVPIFGTKNKLVIIGLLSKLILLVCALGLSTDLGTGVLRNCIRLKNDI